MISKRKSRSLTNLDNTSKTANDHRKPLFVRSNARNKKVIIWVIEVNGNSTHE